jgi:hypothetical protein
LAVLAFAGGGIAVNWLSSAGLSPWSAPAPAAPSSPVLPEPTPHDTIPPVANPVVAAPVVPQIVQPIVDSARTEAMLVAMSARRAVEAGTPLGDLAPRLQSAFGESSPAALAQILAADKERLTAAQMLKDFDAIAPMLRRPSTWNFDRLLKEMSTLFVIRRSDTPPPAEDAQLQIARDYLAAGNVAAALRFVSAMPGAVNAAEWIAKARRYVDRQQALEALEQAALTMSPPPRVPTEPTPQPKPAAPSTESGFPETAEPI